MLTGKFIPCPAARPYHLQQRRCPPPRSSSDDPRAQREETIPVVIEVVETELTVEDQVPMGARGIRWSSLWGRERGRGAREVWRGWHPSSRSSTMCHTTPRSSKGTRQHGRCRAGCPSGSLPSGGQSHAGSHGATGAGDHHAGGGRAHGRYMTLGHQGPSGLSTGTAHGPTAQSTGACGKGIIWAWRLAGDDDDGDKRAGCHWLAARGAHSSDAL